MRLGVCFGMSLPHLIKPAKEAGFDYVECAFASLSRDDDDAFNTYRRALEENDIQCEAANVFLQGDLKIIGTDFHRKEMTDYLEHGMMRGKQVGLKTIVFGSSAARSLPPDVTYAEGFRQLGAFLREVVVPLCEKFDMTVAIEPLRKKESNMINTLREGVALAATADSARISCIADVFHMQKAGETNDDIRFLRGCLCHGHIANPFVPGDEDARLYPQEASEFDYRGFLDALSFAGCERCSIEARCADFNTEIVKSGALLRSLL